MTHLLCQPAHTPCASGFHLHLLCHPCTGLYKADDWPDALAKAKRLVEFGGHGHTSCLYTSPLNHDHIQEFEQEMETVRILINSPASQG